jgi:hypothetical protein
MARGRVAGARAAQDETNGPTPWRLGPGMVGCNVGGDEVRHEGPAAGVAGSRWRDRPVGNTEVFRVPTLRLVVAGALAMVAADALAAFLNAPWLR